MCTKKNTRQLFPKLFISAFLFLLPIAAKAYSVSGQTQLANGDALSSVEITVSNTEFATITTDLQGAYSVDLANTGKPYMISARKTGYTFEPAYQYIEDINQAHTINFVASPVPANPIDRKMIYYYINWGIYGRDFHVHDIPVENITHINYAFLMPFVVQGNLGVDDLVEFRDGQSGPVISVRHVNGYSVGLALTDIFADTQKFNTGEYLGAAGTYVETVQAWLNLEEKTRGVLGQLIQLKKQQALAGKDLKIIASVGGWTLSQHFPAIAENASFRDAFGGACSDFLDSTGFDGIDLDWEFPVVGGTDGTEQINNRLIPAQPHTEDDPVNLLDLLKSIRQAIGHDHELSIACAQASSRVLTQYVWPGTMDAFGRTDNIMDYLDYVNTMTYDYGGYWSSSSSHNAPLYKDTNDPAYNGSVAELIDTLLDENGGNMNAADLVMGMGYYGRAMEGLQPGPNGDGLYQTNPYVGAVYGSWDVNIPDREAAASLDFGDLKFGKALNEHQYINNPDSGFVEYWNDVVKLPYLFNPSRGYFISYDDENSLIEKVRFANARGLGGVMVWEVTQDSKDGYLTQIVHDELASASLNISGTIVTNAGVSASGITVTLNSSGMDAVEYLTDATGAFSFVDLTPGVDYQITFAKSGYIFDRAVYDLGSYNTNHIVLKVHASNQSYTISGTTSSSGNALSGVTVQLSIGSEQVAERTTDQNGYYSFNDFPSGFNYTIAAKITGYENLTGSIDISDLNANQMNQNFNFELNQYTISGSVADANGVLIEGVQIDISGDFQGTYYTDNQGAFSSPLLSSLGTYTLTPVDAGVRFTPTSMTFNGLSSNQNIAFLYDEIPVLSGYVRNGDTPVSGITVILEIQAPGWYYVTRTTDANGFYSFEDIPLGIESSVVSVASWSGTYYPERVAGAFTGSTVVSFNTDSNYVGEYEVDGYVKEDGVGMPNIFVTATDTGDSSESRIRTDSEGYFKFTLVKDRNYRISVDKAFYTFSPSEVAINNLSENVNVGDINATFSGSLFSISGTIVDEESNPIEGVSVALSGDKSLSALSGTDGGFNFSDLREGGSYRVSFSKSSLSFTPGSVNFSSLSKNEVLSVSSSVATFTPLPDRVIVGYWHNWHSTLAPFIRLSEIANTNYNVCDVSFIETWKVGETGAPAEMTEAEEGAYPKFSVYNHEGNYSEENFKADVKALQAAGIPVLISIGGQNGHVELNTEAEKNIYVQGVIDIVAEYGFDGIDIDYEGGSMTVLNGPSNSLEYSAITDPELKYGIDAIREIKAHFGENFLITTAPELYYVQEGRTQYPVGSQFVAFLHNIRDILDMIHVQYYNFGQSLWSALDGTRYDVGDVDLVVAMTDMLIQGFPLTNGLTFPGLREDQVAIGLPCVPNAAGGVSQENPHGYYFTPSEVTHALNYLIKGEKHSSLDYTLRGQHYPNLRGVMTWSINWDATTDGDTAVFEFANTYSTYFDTLTSSPTTTESGTPHSWLEQHGLVTDGNYEAADMMDSDGDGYNNQQEFIMGTIPVDASSVFQLNLASGINGYTIDWSTIENRQYHLQWTDSLNNPFQTIQMFNHPTSSYTDTEHNAIPDNFYRIQVHLNE